MRSILKDQAKSFTAAMTSRYCHAVHNISELSNKYEIPKNLLQLIENKQNAYLALKIVEIIGEDEPYQLDSETIYFITNLLNKIDLIQIRNKVLVSALPQRV